MSCFRRIGKSVQPIECTFDSGVKYVGDSDIGQGYSSSLGARGVFHTIHPAPDN